MILIEEETAVLNDLMEEAFGVRPMLVGMHLSEAYAWMTKLHRYWIERSREAALKG